MWLSYLTGCCLHSHPPILPACPPAAGAGKSSLLAALSGKAAAYGVVTGSTLVNGRPDRLERYKSLMGFVPQVSRVGRLGAGVPAGLRLLQDRLVLACLHNCPRSRVPCHLPCLLYMLAPSPTQPFYP